MSHLYRRILVLTFLFLSTLQVAGAQQMPRVPEEVLDGRVGYSTSYISGGEYAGALVVAGGVKGGVYQQDVLIYDASAGEVITPSEGLVRLGAPRAYHTATTLADGRILFFGGESAPGTYVEIPEVFDPTTFRVSPLALTGADIPAAARKRHAASFFYIFGDPEQFVLLSGGCTGACSGPADRLRSTIIFSVQTNTFMAGPLMQEARQDHRAVYLPAASDLGVVMQLGGGSPKPEHFDVGAFTKTAGSGRFVQDATTTALVESNGVLLGSETAGGSFFSQIPQATEGLLLEEKKREEEERRKAEEDKKNASLLDQLRGLEAVEKQVASLRSPGLFGTVRASDTRGNTAVSGLRAGMLPSEQRPLSTQEKVQDTVATALIAARQERLASLLGGRFSGTGSRLTPVAPAKTYEENLRAHLQRLPEEEATFLRSLTVGSRDSDGDGLADGVETLMGLDPFGGKGDLETFLGRRPGLAGEPQWPQYPSVTALCRDGGTLWGRADPQTEVGFFHQVGTGTRLGFAEAKSDAGGLVMSGVQMGEVAPGARVVMRAMTPQGYAYSIGRSLLPVDCDREALVVVSSVRTEGRRRLLEGAAAPNALVLLHFERMLLVVQTDKEGVFRVPLPDTVRTSVLEVHTWSIHGGVSGPLQTYSLTMPLLSPAAQDSLPSPEVPIPSDVPWFWWLYVMGMLAGVGTLGYTFYTFQRSSREAHDSSSL